MRTDDDEELMTHEIDDDRHQGSEFVSHLRKKFIPRELCTFIRILLNFFFVEIF